MTSGSYGLELGHEPPPAASDRAATRSCRQGGFGNDFRPRRAQHRLGGDERPHRDARRRARGSSAHDLRRVSEWGRVEVDERRHDLQAGLRQAARAVDRRGDDRSEESQSHLGRYGRIVDAQQRLHRRRDLPVGRWRRQLDEHGAAQLRAHREDPRRSDGDQHGLRVRAGEALERQRRARRLQDHRRWKDVDQGAPRRQPVDRVLAADDGSSASQDALCGDVGFPPPRLDIPLGRRQRDGPKRFRSL